MKKFLQSSLFKFVFSVGLGVLIFLFTPSCFSKAWLGGVISILLILINFSSFFSKLPWLTHGARLFVGALFIFSGFIKSNDPIGFGYKLEEYFEVFKADTGMALFDWFAHISMPLAIIVCVSEVALGFLLLIGSYKKITLYLLLAQIVFFTFLTFYSACYNKVTHCGCFGDAIKLTPWESFWKDLILLILITVLFVGEGNINPVFSPLLSNLTTLLAVGASIWFPVHCVRNLPVIDFRAYAPGLSICEGMKPGPNYKPAVIKTMFNYRNLKTGEIKAFDGNNLPYEDTLTWAYEGRLPDEIISKEIDGPKITDFSITNENGDNVTDSILGISNYNFYLVCWNLEKTSQDAELMAKINDFYTLCQKEGFGFIALTASGGDQISDFKHKYNALYDFYNVDGIVLKTMIRSNPGLMLMKDCKVVANWHHNNFPVFSDVKSKYMSK